MEVLMWLSNANRLLYWMKLIVYDRPVNSWKDMRRKINDAADFIEEHFHQPSSV